MRWLLIAITALFTASTVPLPRPGVSASVIIEDRLGGHGSGIFVSSTQVLTAQHVAQMEGIVVRDVEGGLHHILRTDDSQDADVSILTVDHPFTGVVPKISCNPPERGDTLHYYGNPSELEFVGPVYLHFIGGYGGDQMPSNTSLADGVIIGGASGSGVMDERGKVVGIITTQYRDVDILKTDMGDYVRESTPTGIGAYVSFHYPEVCDFVTSQVYSKQYIASK